MGAFRSFGPAFLGLKALGKESFFWDTKSMKDFMTKIISLFLSLFLFLSTGSAYAQNVQSPFLPSKSAVSSTVSAVENLNNYFVHKYGAKQEKGREKFLFDMSLQKMKEDFERNGYVSVCDYAKVMMHPAYLDGLSADEVSEVVYYGHFVARNGYNGEEKCIENIEGAVQSFLNTKYDEESAYFKEDGFLLLASAALAKSRLFQHKIEDQVFNRIEHSSSYPRWATELMYLLVQPPAEYNVAAWSIDYRERFENRLERLVRKFNRLKDHDTDYYMPGVPCNDVFCITNQGALISLFAQTNNYLSMKNDDNIFKQMVSTGGLNFLGRGDRPAFSDKGETFYLHHVTPGTDGKGNMVASFNGEQHLVLYTLLLSLFISYSSRQSTEEASALMKDFVAGYLNTDAEGKFASYLYIPLQAMRMAKILGDTYSLSGWEKEEEFLQNKISSVLNSGYTGAVICNYVQATCEVATEWVAVGEALGLFFKGGKVVVKAVSNKIIQVLPAKVLFNLGAAQIITKQAFKWGRKNIQSLLSRYGWKVAAGAGSAALLTGDESLRQAATY